MLLNCMHIYKMLFIQPIAMADPGWGIWGKCPPPLSHLVEEPAILVIKILPGQDQFSYTPYENMYILLALITISPETEAN